MLIRGFMFLALADKGSFEAIQATDIIIFGLVLNISIFNERYGYFRHNHMISSVSSTVSVIVIVILAITFALILINDVQLLFEPNFLCYVSIIFAAFTLIACSVYMIFIREKNKEIKIDEVGEHG